VIAASSIHEQNVLFFVHALLMGYSHSTCKTGKIDALLSPNRRLEERRRAAAGSKARNRKGLGAEYIKAGARRSAVKSEQPLTGLRFQYSEPTRSALFCQLKTATIVPLR
jgi:hypothetical protein